MAESGIDLATMRKELESQLTRLDGELASLEQTREDARHGKDEYAGYGSNVAEAATETFEAERDLTLIAKLEQMRDQVQAALGRVDSGTFGHCETCGKPIPKERLEALPHATQCVSCKSGENSH